MDSKLCWHRLRYEFIAAAGMKWIRHIFNTYVVLALAVVFVGYHLLATVLGVVSFSQLLLGAPVQSSNSEVADSESSRITVEAGQTLGAVTRGVNSESANWPTRIQSYQLDLDVTVVGFDLSQQSIETSLDTINFLISSAVPNDKSGNMVVFAVNTPNLFGNLVNAAPGHQVVVTANGKDYTYNIIGVKMSQPSQDAEIMAQTHQPTLTLLTADSWNNQRLVITASLQSVKSSTN